MTGEKDELDDFFTALKSGTTVASFLERFERIIQLVHKEGLTKDYRLARRRVKKLRDEVSPVGRAHRDQYPERQAANATTDRRLSGCGGLCDLGAQQGLWEF